MNTTIASLRLSSISRAPFVCYSNHQNPSFFSLHKSYLSHFSSTFLDIHSEKIGAHLSNSRVSHFLDSVVKIRALTIYREHVSNNHSNYSPEINLTVQEMAYKDCHADKDGGAIFVIFNSCVYCNFSTFVNCNVGNKGGAMYIIANQTNITQGCFNDCSARYGSALYIPLIFHELSFEGCSIDNIADKTTTQHASQSIYGAANDIYAADNNFSSISLANLPGPFFSTDHMLNNTRLTLYNLTQLASGGDPNCIFEFWGVSMNKEVNDSNIYACEISSGYIFYTGIEEMVFSRFFFTGNTIPGNCYVVAAELQEKSTTTFSACVFSVPQAQAFYDPLKVIAFAVNTTFESKEITELPHVTSQGCWGHSYYKWNKPKTWLIAIVIIIVVLCLLAAFVYVLVHKHFMDKKLAEENASIIDAGNTGDTLI